MPDNPNVRGPQDAARINVNQTYEVRYWCGVLNCTEQQLRDAVKVVGPMVADVRRYLGR